MFNDENERVFDIKLSIEKDVNAHQTLELRSFVHQFPKDELPEEYYELLRESNLVERNRLKQVLFELYPEEAQKAREIAWRVELGNPEFPSELIDGRITEQLKGENNWVLIGGPPCQAYSLVGRSRRQEREELNPEDHRVFLYKEYLRIIAVHQPAVFVMENVKGLLSAKLGKERVFPQILNDLRNPSLVFPETQSNNYRIYSLTTEAELDENGQTLYESDTDYLIRAEEYGVPQRRHRVILLGIRADIDETPSILQRAESEISLKSVIGDLPKLRSSIGRSKGESFIKNGKKKRVYEIIEDSIDTWGNHVQQFREEIVSWNGFSKRYVETPVNFDLTIGGEFLPYETPSENNPLRNWYRDERIQGVCNHESRTHLLDDLLRYQFSSIFTETYKRSPKLHEFKEHSDTLVPDHENAQTGKFDDRFRTQSGEIPATTVTCHISKDGHYFIHYDPEQCRSWTVREAARVQTFPDNYLFCGSRTAQFHQVGNAVPPYLAKQIGEIVFTIFR
ncbi:MAG: DNA cytosine methyltransferase [Fluviicola sp.]